MDYLFPLFGLILPFISWAIEAVLPYPYLVEESLKAIFVLLIWQFPKNSNQIKATILMAVLFTFSESVFYIVKFAFSGGNFQTILLRFLLTLILHSGTSLIILLPTFKNKKLVLLSLPLAIGVHFLYNSFIQ